MIKCSDISSWATASFTRWEIYSFANSKKVRYDIWAASQKPDFLYQFLFFPSSIFSFFFLLNQGFDPPGWPFSLLALTIWTTLTKALALDFSSQMAHIQQKHLIPLAYRRYPYIIPHNTGRSSSLIIISFVLIDPLIYFSFFGHS